MVYLCNVVTIWFFWHNYYYYYYYYYCNYHTNHKEQKFLSIHCTQQYHLPAANWSQQSATTLTAYFLEG